MTVFEGLQAQVHSMQLKFTPEEIDHINKLVVLTVAQAAFLAGVSVGCVYRRWKLGEGPVSFKIGKARRIRRADLNRWIEGLKK